MPGRVYNGVGLVGLDEFRRDLRAYGRTVPRLLGQANHDAAELGARQARERAMSQGSTARHVAPSIRAGSAARYAYVALGNSSFPMALGAEFGAKHDQPRSTSRGTVKGWNQFPRWVGNQYEQGTSDEGGYFMGPALRDAEPQMLAEYMKLLDQIERTVFNQ